MACTSRLILVFYIEETPANPAQGGNVFAYHDLTLLEMADSHDTTNLAASDDSVPFGSNGSPSPIKGGGDCINLGDN